MKKYIAVIETIEDYVNGLGNSTANRLEYDADRYVYYSITFAPEAMYVVLYFTNINFKTYLKINEKGVIEDYDVPRVGCTSTIHLVRDLLIEEVLESAEVRKTMNVMKYG